MDFQDNQNLIENKEEKFSESGIIAPRHPMSRESGELILEVKNLTVSFGDEKVVDNVSFNLKKGENVAIMGPNGAGKTVLLKALLGLLPYSGEIKWSEDAKISYVPQKILPEKNLPLSIKEFFEMKNAGAEKIKEALLSVGIADENFSKKRIGAVSPGQLQRVLVAWGLIGNPNVLLFDEPTAGIDIGGEETIFNLLNKIEKERNISIILVTHDMSVVYGFADSVLCLNKKLICHGVPSEALDADGLKSLYGEGVNFYKHEH
ncbi:MAG: hypothetical protein UU43_C0006G0013 [Candidatus Falkowbacteria bacterium GW2011_GWA2_41_14]|uniref:ABC transporter domain-containing protein n=1 Tax=Candidatus Falkowbacteria bacterium GW2011_GWA2_41_14 TaxID=1618635 RepID=A0A0G0UV70_9BACT|nr:MAG: hypothetical protein UU43_C0006G0013 [Candidatus Falkowbacteria bacterium GW2011_GWA2_41_14]